MASKKKRVNTKKITKALGAIRSVPFGRKYDKQVEARHKNGWHVEWCLKNIDELRGSGRWVTIHPKHGIIMSDSYSEIRLIGRSRFIKRSILKECVRVSVDSMLELIAPGPVSSVVPTEPLTPIESNIEILARGREYAESLRPQVDLFETPVFTLADYARDHGLKATEVLMHLLSLGMTGVHINTRLDEDTVISLNSRFGILKPDLLY